MARFFVGKKQSGSTTIISESHHIAEIPVHLLPPVTEGSILDVKLVVNEDLTKERIDNFKTIQESVITQSKLDFFSNTPKSIAIYEDILEIDLLDIYVAAKINCDEKILRAFGIKHVIDFFGPHDKKNKKKDKTPLFPPLGKDFVVTKFCFPPLTPSTPASPCPSPALMRENSSDEESDSELSETITLEQPVLCPPPVIDIIKLGDELFPLMDEMLDKKNGSLLFRGLTLDTIMCALILFIMKKYQLRLSLVGSHVKKCLPNVLPNFSLLTQIQQFDSKMFGVEDNTFLASYVSEKIPGISLGLEQIKQALKENDNDVTRTMDALFPKIEE